MKISPYSKGKVYSLNQVKPIVDQFKFILSRSSSYGLFFLYKQSENGHLWVGGPFMGPSSNFFLYLGKQNLPTSLKASFSSVILRNLENDWKRLLESNQEHPFDLLMPSPEFQYRRWATEFFRFENSSFKKFF